MKIEICKESTQVLLSGHFLATRLVKLNGHTVKVSSICNASKALASLECLNKAIQQMFDLQAAH